DGLHERALAAGEQRDHLRWIGRERRRAFGRLERGEPAARAGADEDEAARASERVARELDEPRDVVARRARGLDRAEVLRLERVDDPARVQQVERDAAASFGRGQCRFHGGVSYLAPRTLLPSRRRAANTTSWRPRATSSSRATSGTP